MQTSSLHRWLLGLLLLWSFAARLLFSWPDPTLNRFWDERYNAGNVAAILALDRWQPIRTHYPTLSYVPHAATLKIYETARQLPSLSSAPPSFGVPADGRPFLTRTGLRICRVIQTLVGVGSLFVVFLIGRRLFGPWVGLGATFLLAMAPWHLRLSALFKPDIMLVLTATLAVYAMLRARHRDSLGGYAIAGALVGACTASKWNGAALVLPLLVTIALGGVDRRWLFPRRCLAAGAAGAAVLVALNPWLILTPEVYRRLAEVTEHLRHGLREVGRELEVPVQVTGLGSLFGIHFQDEDIVGYRDIAREDSAFRHNVFLGLLNEGILIAPNLVGAISTVLGEDEVDTFVDAFRTVLQRQV